MGWSYDPSLGAAKDKVRFLCQDTDPDDQFLSDEEILFTLSEQSQNVYRAAELVCRTLAAQFAKQIGITDSRGITFNPVTLSDKYEALADRWARQALMSGAVGMFAGGISRSSKLTAEQDTDRVAPAFGVETHRTPGSAPEVQSLDDNQ